MYQIITMENHHLLWENKHHVAIPKLIFLRAGHWRSIAANSPRSPIPDVVKQAQFGCENRAGYVDHHDNVGIYIYIYGNVSGDILGCTGLYWHMKQF